MSLDQALFLAVGALVAAITALVGAVVFLFKLYQSQFASLEARVNECDKDRRELWTQIASLQRAVPPRT